MAGDGSMSISEFAGATGIKRANLLFYDQIGLLSPESRGKNGYRRYHRRQLGSAYLIASLREIGVSIAEIKRYAQGRTPERMLALFAEQEGRIRAEISRLQEIIGMLRLYTDMAKSTFSIDSEEIQVVRREREPLFPGLPIPLGQTEDEAILRFYDYAAAKGISPSYPFGVMIGRETLERGFPIDPQRFYLKIPKGGASFKPAGTYVTGCLRGDYGESAPLYARLLAYIRERGLIICGNAFEEYPLNEMSIRRGEDYLIRVEIMVEAFE